MAKTFYTERDIEDMARRGVTSLVVSDDIVLTDLARELALKNNIRLVRETRVHPEDDGNAELVHRVKAAVIARLGLARVDFVKIDVEGAEYEVLYNARTLAKIRNIRGEFHANAYLRSRGFDMDELKDYCDRIIGPGHTRFTRCTMPDL